MLRKRMRIYEAGFSMVELAIVIVIIGLLIVSVLAGKNLIDASRVRAAINEVETLQGSFVRFEEKYLSLPGDMPDASAYFTTPTAAPNGNGNGQIPWLDDAGVNEGAAAFLHLQRASMLGGDPLTGTDVAVDIGTNAMSSSVPNAGFIINYDAALGNFFKLGASTGANDNPIEVLTTEAASSIDEKMDDGAPTTGRVRGLNGTGTTLCLAGTIYNFDSTPITCVMQFRAANEL